MPDYRTYNIVKGRKKRAEEYKELLEEELKEIRYLQAGCRYLYDHEYVDGECLTCSKREFEA